MMSEWLVEVPEDLASKWLLILCPEGRRNLVIAANGSTKGDISRLGSLFNRFGPSMEAIYPCRELGCLELVLYGIRELA